MGMILLPALVVADYLLRGGIDGPHKEEDRLEALVRIIHLFEVRLILEETEGNVPVAAVVVFLRHMVSLDQGKKDPD